MKYDVVRAMLITGNEHGMFKAQFDVCRTYLDVDLMHFIFMEQREGFEDVWWFLFVHLLLKSLNGLKQKCHVLEQKIRQVC